MVDQHLLKANHILDRHGRERHRVRATGSGIDRTWPGRTSAARKHIGTNDDVLVGIEPSSRASMSSHQPRLPVSLSSPAAWASPENACRTRIALVLEAFSSP